MKPMTFEQHVAKQREIDAKGLNPKAEAMTVQRWHFVEMPDVSSYGIWAAFGLLCVAFFMRRPAKRTAA